MARQVSSTNTAGSVYTLGPLIHNSGVLDSLKERGVICLEPENSADEIPEVPEKSTIIIRAHGVSPAVERELVQRGMAIVDATCPHVKVSQRKAANFAANGYKVFLAGEKNHAEIKAILGYVQDAACGCGLVVSSPSEAEAASEELHHRAPEAKTALVGQTTIRAEEYSGIAERIRRFFPSLEIVDSICDAAAERQGALRDLCGKVDALVIVGSRGSANTRRLLSLVQELGKPAWLVETAAGLPPEIGAYKSVGLSAGASTPDGLIDEVEEALKKGANED
jgi:4-hydroxy-3-methylbut-2-enyl diphosphate reductase